MKGKIVSAKRPNILFLITDQFHPGCLGYAGHPVVQTPNLDALAETGRVFARMYTPQPLCMPARASLFTGLTPRGHKVRMNGIPLDSAIPTFTEALRQNGYRTHCCGKIHLCNCTPPKGVLNILVPIRALTWQSNEKRTRDHLPGVDAPLSDHPSPSRLPIGARASECFDHICQR